MKRMLFNATQPEELRVAIVDGQKLIDLDIESAGKEQKKVTSTRVSSPVSNPVEAAFVDYGGDRHGFLPFKEVGRANFQANVEVSKARVRMRCGGRNHRPGGQDERGTKGAALTTVSLAGRYLVLCPKPAAAACRAGLRRGANELGPHHPADIPQGMSVCHRGIGPPWKSCSGTSST